MKITIGIPAYNEEKNIADIVNKLKEKYESIIVCDDGSTDSTYEILKTMKVMETGGIKGKYGIPIEPLVIGY